MPTHLSARAAVTFGIGGFFQGGQVGRIFRIETDGDDLILSPHVEIDFLQAVDQAVEYFSTKHGATIVGKHKDDRLLGIEVIAKLDRGPGFIAKSKIEWNLLV